MNLLDIRSSHLSAIPETSAFHLRQWAQDASLLVKTQRRANELLTVIPEPSRLGVVRFPVVTPGTTDGEIVRAVATGQFDSRWERIPENMKWRVEQWLSLLLPDILLPPLWLYTTRGFGTIWDGDSAGLALATSALSFWTELLTPDNCVVSGALNAISDGPKIEPVNLGRSKRTLVNAHCGTDTVLCGAFNDFPSTLPVDPLLAMQKILQAPNLHEQLRRKLQSVVGANFPGVRLGRYLLGAPIAEWRFGTRHHGVDLGTGATVELCLVRDDRNTPAVWQTLRAWATVRGNAAHLTRSTSALIGVGRDPWLLTSDASVKDEPWFRDLLSGPRYLHYYAEEAVRGRSLAVPINGAVRATSPGPAAPQSEGRPADSIELQTTDTDPVGRVVNPHVVLKWLLQLADGMAELHAAGLSHNAIAAENLVVTASGAVRLRRCEPAGLQIASGDDETSAVADASAPRRRDVAALTAACVRAVETGGLHRVRAFRRFRLLPRLAHLLRACMKHRPEAARLSAALVCLNGKRPLDLPECGVSTPRTGRALLLVQRHPVRAVVLAAIAAIAVVSSIYSRSLAETLDLANKNLAHAHEQQARIATNRQEWDRAAMHYAAASKDSDRRANMWRSAIALARAPKPTLRVWDRAVRPSSIAFSPDGRYLAVGTWSSEILVWDMECKRVVRTPTGHRNVVTHLSFSSNGKRFVSHAKGDGVRIWKKEDDGSWSST